MDRLDLNVLVSLHALLEERSVTRAAARLRVGQPAMSATLARLRTLLADDILIRDGRGMKLTPVAEALTESVTMALEHFEAILKKRRHFDAATLRTTFTIMTSDYVGLVLLQPLLRQLEDEAPFVRIQTRPLTHDFASRLRSGTADLAIVPSELARDTTGLGEEHLFTDYYVSLIDPAFGTSTTVERTGGDVTELHWTDLDRTREVQGEIPGTDGPHSQHFTTGSFLLSAYLVQGTESVCVAPQKLATTAEQRFGLAIQEAGTTPSPIHVASYWSARTADDAGHLWLRGKLLDVSRFI